MGAARESTKGASRRRRLWADALSFGCAPHNRPPRAGNTSPEPSVRPGSPWHSLLSTSESPDISPAQILHSVLCALPPLSSSFSRAFVFLRPARPRLRRCLFFLRDSAPQLLVPFPHPHSLRGPPRPLVAGLPAAALQAQAGSRGACWDSGCAWGVRREGATSRQPCRLAAWAAEKGHQCNAKRVICNQGYRPCAQFYGVARKV